jgi:hypothetical protein
LRGPERGTSAEAAPIVSIDDLARRSHQGEQRGGLSAETVVGTLAAIGEPRVAAAPAIAGAAHPVDDRSERAIDLEGSTSS